ncbi:MAG: hypothetical protein A2Y79_04815 [Deltaproteobacteria bacterium RBG_13_43_22]|nr:MAG: hypothetical protein A2Y79_04815 [Deltaproteobacteria bacterium RBG_13_43_22]
MTDSDNTGHIDYPREGFTIFWDAHGLRIDVIDYNAEPLYLSWDTILDLAKRAGSGDSFTDEMGLVRK